MGDNPKQRGVRNLKNKKKYKDGSKISATTSTIRSKSPPALNSNWDRYGDNIPDPKSCGIPCGLDFSVLASAPISKGSHFQFKSDADSRYDVDHIPVDTSGLFNLDINLLGLSVSSIKFSERCKIPENSFTEDQHNIMDHYAKENAMLYRQYLLNQEQTVNSIPKEGLHFRKNSPKDSIHHFSTEEELAYALNRSLNSILRNSTTDRLNINCGDKFIPTIVKQDESTLDISLIDHLNKLEEKLNRASLIKESSQDAQKKAVPNSSIEVRSIVPLSQVSGKRSSDTTDGRQADHVPGHSVETGSSMMETESLQQWLDDVLGD